MNNKKIIYKRNRKIIFELILKNNLIFIYPCCTLFGIGGNEKHKLKILELKKRKNINFLRIYPKKKKLKEFFSNNNYFRILRNLNKNENSILVSNKKNKLIGIRCCKNFFSRNFNKNYLISTSANLSSEKNEILKINLTKIFPELLIFDGKISMFPSKIFNFFTNKFSR